MTNGRQAWTAGAQFYCANYLNPGRALCNNGCRFMLVMPWSCLLPAGSKMAIACMESVCSANAFDFFIKQWTSIITYSGCHCSSGPVQVQSLIACCQHQVINMFLEMCSAQNIHVHKITKAICCCSEHSSSIMEHCLLPIFSKMPATSCDLFGQM